MFIFANNVLKMNHHFDHSSARSTARDIAAHSTIFAIVKPGLIVRFLIPLLFYDRCNPCLPSISDSVTVLEA